MLSNLNKVQHVGKDYTKRDYLDELLDWDTATDALTNALKPLIYTILTRTGQDAMQEVGKQPSQFDPYAEAIQTYFTNRATKIAQDVNDETEKQLRAALGQGIDAGESTSELRARVEDIMGSASTVRADRIARTEVTRAQGYGDVSAWTQSSVVSGKEWFTAEDEHVCPFCDSLDGKIEALDSNFFDKGDSLKVGDQSQSYNYDDIPTAPLHPNCRCTILPVRN